MPEIVLTCPDCGKVHVYTVKVILTLCPDLSLVESVEAAPKPQ